MGMLEYLHSGKELKEMPVGSSISGKSLDGITYTPLICISDRRLFTPL